MRKIIYYILILVLTTQIMEAQWVRQTNMTGNLANHTYLDVFFLNDDPNYGWVCGFNGVTIRTTNGGEQWLTSNVNANVQLETIQFLNRNVGFASGPTGGTGAIFKSTNGGATWFDISPERGVSLWGFHFYDENHGLVLGGQCETNQSFFRTTDGGMSWLETQYFESDSKLSDPLLLDPNGICYATSSGKIWKSVDGGYNWVVHSITGENDWHEEIAHYGRSFLVPYSVTCTGTFTNIGGARFSTDYGGSWRDFPISYSMFGAFLHDELRGWAVGFNSSVYYTSDGGITWELQNCGIDDGGDMDDIYFINDTLGYVVGVGVYKYRKIQILNPEIPLPSEVVLCEGETIKLYTKEKYDEYYWSTGETSDTIYVDSPGVYSVEVVSNKCDKGKSEVISVLYFEPEDFKIVADADPPYCEGDVIKLSIVPEPASAVWEPTGSNEFSIDVNKSGTYTAIVTDEHGCEYVLEREITIHPQPDVKIIKQQRDVYCYGSEVELIGQGAEFYEWYEEGNDEPISLAGSIQIKDSGRFYLYGYNSSGCDDSSDTIEIQFIDTTNQITFRFQDDVEIFDMGDANYGILNCATLEVQNISNDIIYLNDFLLKINTNFSLPYSQLPIVILPNDLAYIKVCFTPNQFDVVRDTLILFDLCSDHYIPLKAIGVPNQYSGVGPCEIIVDLDGVDLIYKTKSLIYNPYPNPSQDYIDVAIDMISRSEVPTHTSGKIINNLGQVCGIGEFTVNDVTHSDDYYFIQSEMRFDVEKFPTGMYYIVIEQFGQSRAFAVSVTK